MGTWTLPLSKIRAVARGTGCGGDLGRSGEDRRVWMLSPADPRGVGCWGRPQASICSPLPMAAALSSSVWSFPLNCQHVGWRQEPALFVFFFLNKHF